MEAHTRNDARQTVVQQSSAESRDMKLEWQTLFTTQPQQERPEEQERRMVGNETSTLVKQESASLNLMLPSLHNDTSVPETWANTEANTEPSALANGILMVTMSLEKDMYFAWCTIGDRFCLDSHSKIAEFLVHSYENKSEADSSKSCGTCGSALSWQCLQCHSKFDKQVGTKTTLQGQKGKQRQGNSVYTHKPQTLSSHSKRTVTLFPSWSRNSLGRSSKQPQPVSKRSHSQDLLDESLDHAPRFLPAADDSDASSVRTMSPEWQPENSEKAAPATKNEPSTVTKVLLPALPKKRGRPRKMQRDEMKVRRLSKEELREKSASKYVDRGANVSGLSNGLEMVAGVKSSKSQSVDEDAIVLDSPEGKEEQMKKAKVVKQTQTEKQVGRCVNKDADFLDLPDGKGEEVKVAKKKKKQIDRRVDKDADVSGEGGAVVTKKKKKLGRPSSSHIVKSSNGLYECSHCGKRYTSLAGLSYHLQTKHNPGGPPNVCDTCGKMFSTPQTLRVHYSTVHLALKPYMCNICHNSFSQRSNLRAHKETHSEDKPHVCNICGKSYKSLKVLKAHSIIHSGHKDHVCEVCAKTFNKLCNLKRHRLIHTEQRPFVCNICSKTFSQSSHLHVHMRVHLPHLRDPAKKPQKSYVHKQVCHTCGKSYFSNYMKLHKMTHTGEKPHVCNVCQKSFRQAITLKAHQLMHTGTKPYICPHCHKAFTLSVSLRMHRQIHEGSQIFECDVCHKVIKYLKNFRRHKRLHDKAHQLPPPLQ